MGFFKSIANVVTAPVAAAVNTVKSVATGDVGGAVKGAVSSVTSVNPVAQIENAAGTSLTGIGSVSQGDYSPETIQKLQATALGVGGALLAAPAIGGALSSAKESVMSATGVGELSELTPYLGAVKGAVSSNRGPTGEPVDSNFTGSYLTTPQNDFPVTELALIGAGGLALFLFLRKGKK